MYLYCVLVPRTHVRTYIVHTRMCVFFLLLVVVVVLARRGGEDGSYEYEYEYEDDKEYADIPKARTGPPSAGPPPAQNVDPTMAAALAEFPQWDQATIQGYFDQGWDIDSLKDWVNNNQ